MIMQNPIIRFVLALMCSSLALGDLLASDTADTIYRGGPILTMDDAAPPPSPILMAGPPIWIIAAPAGMSLLCTLARFMFPIPPATMMGL